MDPEWNKVCFNEPQTQKQICQTTRLFGDRAENPVLSILVTDPGGADKAIQVLAPMGVALRPGFRIGVDKGAPEGGAYELCTPQGAYGGLHVKQTFVDSMKKGEKLAVSVKTINGAEFVFNLPLVGFGKAFDGPGIDPKHAENIFDAFVTTKSHGMGLGLALCRMIIERHSGQLTASPAHPRGSIFRIGLPILVATR